MTDTGVADFSAVQPLVLAAERVLKTTVLACDVPAEAQRQVTEILTSAGVSSITYCSLEQADEALRLQRPTLILVDLDRAFSGPDPAQLHTPLVALRTNSATSSIPILALASLNEADATPLFGAGANDVVRKPWRQGEFTARVQAQLSGRRTVDELARRTRDAELLVDLTQALATSLDLREILYTLVVRTAEVLHVDRVSIVLVRDTDDRGVVVVTSDDPSMRDLSIDLSRYPEVQQALSDRAPVVIEDAVSHPLLNSLRSPGSEVPVPFASLAVVPLMFEERPMGVLFLRAREATTFDDRTLALCRTLANATAVSLRNARILQSLRDQTQQITYARYEAERRLRALQRHADFFESIDDGVAVIDHDGFLLFANPRAKVLTGYADEDLQGVRLGALVPEEDRDQLRQVRDQIARREYPRGVDMRIRRKDGQVRTFSVTWSSVLHEENAALLTLRDVTQEREDALELAQTKEFLERLIDSSVDAIVSADMRGRIVLFNRAAERVYGLVAREVLGSSVERLYPKGVARRIMTLIRGDSYGGKGRLEGYRCDFLTHTGEIVPISLSAALIQRGDRTIGTVGIFTDLRDRLRIEQRLAHAQEQLRVQEKQTIVAELAGAAAHELNQPLTSVMGYAELLRRRLDVGSPQHHACEVILSEAERMAEIVRKIGKITRYETKSYVGTARILDLDRASSDAPISSRASVLAARSEPPTQLTSSGEFKRPESPEVSSLVPVTRSAPAASQEPPASTEPPLTRRSP